MAAAPPVRTNLLPDPYLQELLQERAQTTNVPSLREIQQQQMLGHDDHLHFEQRTQEELTESYLPATLMEEELPFNPDATDATQTENEHAKKPLPVTIRYDRHDATGRSLRLYHLPEALSSDEKRLLETVQSLTHMPKKCLQDACFRKMYAVVLFRTKLDCQDAYRQLLLEKHALASVA